VYLSEMAPAKLRGALNIMFQLATSIGAPAISTFWVMPICTGAQLLCVSYATSLPAQSVAVRPQCLLLHNVVRGWRAGAKHASEHARCARAAMRQSSPDLPGLPSCTRLPRGHPGRTAGHNGTGVGGT